MRDEVGVRSGSCGTNLWVTTSLAPLANVYRLLVFNNPNFVNTCYTKKLKSPSLLPKFQFPIVTNIKSELCILADIFL